MNLYSQLEKIVKIQPSHDAIEWESGVISYFEFYRLANSIAFSLNKKFKLKHGHKVALVMENSFICERFGCARPHHVLYKLFL